MNEILINIFLYIGYTTCIVVLIWVVYVALLSLIALYCDRKYFARVILDNVIRTKLKTTSKEDLEKWINRIREKHQKINQEKEPIK